MDDPRFVGPLPFFTSDDNGHLYRSQTSLGNFPNGMENTAIALQDMNIYASFEASNVYSTGNGEYLLLIEAIGSDDASYFRSWTSASLSGAWTSLADTEVLPFVRSNNVMYSTEA